MSPTPHITGEETETGRQGLAHGADGAVLRSPGSQAGALAAQEVCVGREEGLRCRGADEQPLPLQHSEAAQPPWAREKGPLLLTMSHIRTMVIKILSKEYLGPQV